MTYQLLCFDLDNTLWENDSVIEHAEICFHQRVIHCLDGLIKNEQLVSMVSRAALTEHRHRYAQQHPALLSQLSALRQRALADFLQQQLSVPASHIPMIVDECFEHFLNARNQVTLFDDTLPTLTHLKQHYTLAALTNGNSSLHTIGLAPLFDICLSAEQVQARKPHPAMFEQAMASAQVEPQQVLHIGDHPWDDVYGAQQLGIHTVWFNPQQKSWLQESDGYNDAIAKPDYEIACLKDLLTFTANRPSAG